MLSYSTWDILYKLNWICMFQFTVVSSWIETGLMLLQTSEGLRFYFNCFCLTELNLYSIFRCHAWSFSYYWQEIIPGALSSVVLCGDPYLISMMNFLVFFLEGI